jgi:hypothetical protein
VGQGLRRASERWGLGRSGARVETGLVRGGSKWRGIMVDIGWGLGRSGARVETGQ